jgi:hypothetical protein
MADDKLFPYQARVPVTMDGALPSIDLLRYLNKVFAILGGFDATTNYQLAQNVRSLTDAVGLHVFERPHPNPKAVRPGQFIDITQDLGGYTVSLRVGDVIGAVLPFLPRSEAPKQRPVDDAGQILANRVFRA